MMPKYVADGLNFVKFLIFRATIEIGFPPACARAPTMSESEFLAAIFKCLA